MSKHIQNRLHYSKMVHDILPTLAYLNKQDNGKRLCPCCRHPHETRDHILRCPARRIIQDGHLHRTQSDSTSPTGKITGAIWQTKLILFIWKQWRLVWKLRNESLHGKDTAAQVVAEASEVRRRLIEIYDLRSQMEPSVQSLLCTDIHQHLLKPTWTTTNWLHIHVPLFGASLRRVKARAIQGVRNIRTYFGPS